MSSLSTYISPKEVDQIKSDLNLVRTYMKDRREIQDRTYYRKVKVRGTIGTLLGGALGGLAGYAASPRNAQKPEKIFGGVAVGGLGALTGLAFGSASALSSAQKEAQEKTADHPGIKAHQRISKLYKDWINIPYSGDAIRQNFKNCVSESFFPPKLYYASEQDEITGPYNEFIDSMKMVRCEEHRDYCYIAANLKTVKGPFTYELLLFRNNQGKFMLYQWRITGGHMDEFAEGTAIRQELYSRKWIS